MKEGRVSIANIVKEILDQPGRLLGRVVKGGGWRLGKAVEMGKRYV